MRGATAFLLLLSALAMPALAGNVYRCDSGDGITSYANKRVPGASCKLVGSYKPQPAKKFRAAPVIAASDAPATAAPRKDVAISSAVPPATFPASPAAASAPPAATSYNAPRMVRGQVYAYVGKDGVRNYTSVRPRGVAGGAVRTIKYSYMETCFACGTRPGVNFGKLRLNTAAYQAEIAAAAREHGVDEAIVRAIIHAESAYNPLALSRVGAQGLMQLMPATAREEAKRGDVPFTDGTLPQPAVNIDLGSRYLSRLVKQWKGNLPLAVASYNAGPGAVSRWIERGGVSEIDVWVAHIPYAETRTYVGRVLGNLARYARLTGSTPPSIPLALDTSLRADDGAF